MERVIAYNLTENFISRVASFVEENFLKTGADLARIAFVFGGKRPALFLKKELSLKIKQGFFSPRFFSIDEFIEYTLLKKITYGRISDLDAAYLLYNLAKKISPGILKDKEDFSKFLPWAREILLFIEQLDFEDIKLGPLENIQFKARIGYDVPSNINVLMQELIALRDAYHTALREKNNFSCGLIYLKASESIQEIDFAEFDYIIFCGLFYLHKTEERIIKHLYDRQKAILIFQGDSKEYGVLEKLSKSLLVPISPKLRREPEFKLSIQTGFDVHSEAGLVREALSKAASPDKTVIVLPIPENVIPLLSEVSSLTDNFNVSMGYPLKRSSLYALFEELFRCQGSKKGLSYYAKDYLNVLSHPLVKNLRFDSLEPSVTRVLTHKIEEILKGIEKTPLGGSLFIELSEIETSRDLYELSSATMKNMGIEVSYDEIKNALKQLHQLLFKSWEDVSNFLGFSVSLESFLKFLVEKSFIANFPLNLKIAEKLFAINDEFSVISFISEPFSQEEIFKIFKNRLENEMISFSGSPLKELQILGLFETRSLNFENVIIMDVNESGLPNLRIQEPLIPREVMISLGLNQLEKEEEIQRYQFLRLISGAKNVLLIYQKRPDKERSRFIEELIWEKQKVARELDVMPIPHASFEKKVLPKKLEIKKNCDVVEFLKKHLYSSSSVNTYMRCPLRFYYQYCLGLSQKEDLLSEAEGADMGTFIHELLKEAFSKFIHKKPCLNGKFRKEFFAQLDKKFSDEFQKRMKSDAFLVKEVLDFRMKKFLDNEIQRDVKRIICVEEEFSGYIPLSCGKFKFKAVVDRIDLLSNNSFLILDYKTGSIDMPLSIERIESAGWTRESLKNTIKSFQLPIYLYLVTNQPCYSEAKTCRHSDCVTLMRHSRESGNPRRRILDPQLKHSGMTKACRRDHFYVTQSDSDPAKGGGRIYAIDKINAALYSIRDMQENFGLKMLLKEEDFLKKDKVISVYLDALNAIISEIINSGIPFSADTTDPQQCQYCPFFYLCR
ncbi:MAG: PD-(D/E)XK nuclease family protein [Candidatus Omnitrophota bacterium]|nr:PD-(D/E)XK nuclease family protein [Candidatus Omnitrophota bacterium]